jgi:hypothetical protein
MFLEPQNILSLFAKINIENRNTQNSINDDISTPKKPVRATPPTDGSAPSMFCQSEPVRPSLERSSKPANRWAPGSELVHVLQHLQPLPPCFVPGPPSLPLCFAAAHSLVPAPTQGNQRGGRRNRERAGGVLGLKGGGAPGRELDSRVL